MSNARLAFSRACPKTILRCQFYKILGNTSIQDIYVYTKDTEIVSKVLENINL